MIAALYDVHGNLPALEAVVGDAEKAGVERYLLGGDYASFGAWPTETLDLLSDLSDATWIRGNWERRGAQPASDRARKLEFATPIGRVAVVLLTDSASCAAESGPGTTVRTRPPRGRARASSR